ncbi:MAG: hypothetical protein FJ280_22380 [Planctomycetes bacterium]|nr:hypothetical protein [Planctomycetota bacterium]
MSRSRNTEKESVWAGLWIDRDEDGVACLPRIVARRPREGDVHPLSKSILAGALKTVPVEYLYGLSRVELRATKGKIGDPFGAYRPREKVIILYSLPRRWVVDRMSEGGQRDLEAFGARVLPQGGQWHVDWPSEAGPAVWFFKEVLTHELGHHFAEQYKNKRGRIRGVKFREMNADLHSCRLTREMFRRLKRRRETK